MKVTSISIKHVMGFKEKSIVAGKVTEISGGNAVGKTSLLEAVKATLGRGALGRLARVDSDETPETVLTIPADFGQFTHTVVFDGQIWDGVSDLCE